MLHDKDYILVHAGLEPFDKNRPLHKYGIAETVFGRCNYDRPYFENKYVVPGHTPTVLIDPNCVGRIIEKNNHIAIDCGCVFGFALGVHGLDNENEYYVEKSRCA